MSNVANAAFMARLSLLRSWGAMTFAPVVQAVDFKRCCLKSKRYDGVIRDYYF